DAPMNTQPRQTTGVPLSAANGALDAPNENRHAACRPAARRAATAPRVEALREFPGSRPYRSQSSARWAGAQRPTGPPVASAPDLAAGDERQRDRDDPDDRAGPHSARSHASRCPSFTRLPGRARWPMNQPPNFDRTSTPPTVPTTVPTSTNSPSVVVTSGAA